jgi:hypothetical protein
VPAYGYPDWSRSSTGLDTPVFDDDVPISNLLTITTAAANIYAPNTLLTFNNRSLVSYIEITFQWSGYGFNSADAATDVITIGPQQQGTILVPTRAPFLQIETQASVSDVTQNLHLVLAGTATNLRSGMVAAAPGILAADVSGYGAGAAKTFLMNNWHRGDALVNLGSSGGFVGFASFQAYRRSTGTFVEFATVAMLASNNALPVRIVFPARPVQAVVNNVGAAQNIGFGVVAG